MTVTGSFTIPLDLPLDPPRLWPLLAELDGRRTWVRMPGPSATATHELDFRVGGGERLTNTFVSGDSREELENRSTIHDIVPERRIVSSYEALVGGELRWVALVTVDITPSDPGSHLDWTEQYSFVRLSDPSGEDDANHLRVGTRLRLNGLFAAAQERATAPAGSTS